MLKELQGRHAEGDFALKLTLQKGKPLRPCKASDFYGTILG
jgi:hypothetical protein